MRMQAFDIAGGSVGGGDLGSYMALRQAVPKPVSEDRHARHIQRFYACRGLRRAGYPELFVLPDVTAGDRRFHPDVVGRRGDGLEFVYCAAHSLDEVPIDEIRTLTAEAGPMIMLVVANVLDVDGLSADLADLVASGRVSVRTMTLPPFDDVLEYDIWMFELTFQEAVR
ncbi:MAG TPA: hypothetical protein VFS32_12190 [Candidatus Limnocylindrales bacterium]|nr:hypothetical protein [Candidatus Limnocylindrales bacterium]